MLKRNILLAITQCLLSISILSITYHSALIAALGQSATATLSGIVVDEKEAVVPNAKVTLINVNTRLQREATTNTDGYFTIPLLPPSTYKLRIERNGFSLVEVNDIVLNVGDQRALQIPLKVGKVDETVNIEATAGIQESAAVSTIVDRQFVENLPLNGRSFQSLITLTPGVVLNKSTAGNVDQGQFSVNGQRPNANYFTVDGVSANMRAATGASAGQNEAGSLPATTTLGGTNNLVSVDALQEFQILTSTFAPEFGRTPGAQVSIVTRSGTNGFHGTLFEYFRNDVFDANNWFANRENLPKPPLRQNDFGGVVGGPVLLPVIGHQPLYDGHDKTFFFFSYEGLRLVQPQVGITSVPSISARQTAPAGVKPLLDGYPVPNGPALNNGNAQFAASYSNPATLNATSIRIDHTVSNKLSLFGRFNYAPSNSKQRDTSMLSSVFYRAQNTETLTGGAIWALAPSTSNDFRANWSKATGDLIILPDDFGGATQPPESFFFPYIGSRGKASSIFGISGRQLANSVNNLNQQRQLNFVDNLSTTFKSHQLKFGVDYRRLCPIMGRVDYLSFVNFTDVAGAGGVAIPGTALSGIATTLQITARANPKLPVYTNLSLFAQDTWRATRRITLTYGLRWEFNPPPTDKNGIDPVVLRGLDDPATITLAPLGTPIYEATYNNFAPRFGLAYQLFQNRGRETILRGGFGIFYDIGNGQVAELFGVDSVSKTVTNGAFPYTQDFAQPPVVELFPTLPTSRTFRTIVPDLKLPYTYQWNVSVEQSLGSSQTVTASYVAAVGRRLLRGERFVRPNPNFTGTIQITRNSATSDYQSLQVQFQRRLSRGLQSLISYTWSHSIDTASQETYINPRYDTNNPNRDRGASEFDRRHSFSAAVTYNLPNPALPAVAKAVLRNWSIDTIVRVLSAAPVDILTGVDIFGEGGAAWSLGSRPDLKLGVPLYIYDSSLAGGKRFNAAAFDAATPTSARRQGTLGRNVLRGFNISQVDLALRRQFNLTERLNLQFRAEFFNLFNHPNFADPGAQFSNGNVLSNPLFGLSTAMLGTSFQGLNPIYQIGGPRSAQFALRFSF